MWHEDQVLIKEKKVVVKLKNYDGTFKKSCTVPSVMYPLNGKYEVFTSANTKEVTDENIFKVFDSVKYNIGKCYQNTIDLAAALNKNGIDVKTYVGWLFTSGTDFPIHHCWAVVNGESVLDLSDDYSVMLGGPNGKLFEGKTEDEKRLLMAEFQRAAGKLPNRVRCAIVGRPTSFFFYVGSECDPEEGRRIYRELMRTYPNHEAERNVGPGGYNKTQKLYKDLGLME